MCDIRSRNHKLKTEMKKILMTIVSLAAVATAFAGGTNVNTNHTVNFIRGVARGTTLDPDAVYHNPAGAAMMENGFHFTLSIQEAIQNRSTVSTFAPFEYNTNGNRTDTREFVGKTFAPVIPSVDFVWKKNRWAVMASFGIGGGGGTAKFNNGLASFESMVGQLPFGVGMQVAGRPLLYSMDMYIKGSSMTFQGQVGVAFKITEWLSVAAQARLNYATKSYTGYLKNIQMLNPMSGEMAPAAAIFQSMGLTDYADMTADHTLDVSQSGWSISPVVAIMFKKDGWAATAKYEFKQSMSLTNATAAITAKDPVLGTMFADGAKTKADMPALLSIAASKTFCEKFTITGEWHYYFDKDAQNSFTPAILNNTQEYLAGLEYKINSKWLVSAGYQYTDYSLNPQAYSDLDFQCDSHAIGLGFAYNFNKHIRLNAGAMGVFYKDVVKESAVYNDNSLGLPGKDIFKNSRYCWGLGLDFHF